jgi:DNA-binding transcriptional ArsR family regulator/precorrin-6B methylase 2
VTVLRAAGEPTRLRALALLSHGELSVGELAQALGQSQPRVSRHLRLLTEAGLVERTPEGAWAFYRLAAPIGPERALAELFAALTDPDDPMVVRDAQRLAGVRAAREAAASAYFEASAGDWDRIRKLHLPEADIEAAILAAAGPGPFGLMIDAGVGAGRLIQAFAGRVERAEGFDTSRPMLAMARAALDGAGELRATVRRGDIYDPPAPSASADLVTISHVLHFLADPKRALKEAARLLKPGGRIVVVDFARHTLEFLREKHAHRRLGFADAEVEAWLSEAGVANLATTTLAPDEPGAEKLTVKIWAGDRAGLAAAAEKAA